MAGTDEQGFTQDQDEVASPGAYLNWAGRRGFRARLPAPRVLERVHEQSDPNDGRNESLVLDGDNLQAMVSLHGQYAGAVDVVLIDPPYNTGKNDFRYSDRRFHDPNADAGDGDFVSAQDGGRHTKWLNFMAPRLLMIRELMAPHGVIFVHISDIELPRLLMLMEEIFREQNRIGMIVWRGVTDNNPGRIVVEHEYVVCYAKHIESVSTEWTAPEGEIRDWIIEHARGLAEAQPDLGKAQTALRATLAAEKVRLGNFARYYRLDEHWRERGPYAAIRNTDNPGKPGYFYDVYHPTTKKVVTKPGTGYRFKPETMERLLAEDRVVFGKDEKKLLEIKRYVSELEFPLRSVINLDARAGANTLAALFGREDSPFRNPKPVELEELLLSYTTKKDALVLDCFAGSGTTGHAVWRLNGRDGGLRRFILVEEGNGDDKFAGSLTAERLRRARTNEHLDGSFGFFRVGEMIDRQAFATFQRHTIVEAVRQADASGRRAGIHPIDGNLVVGANHRNQAICLGFVGEDGGSVTADMLAEMYREAKRLGLSRPLRVYGAACEVIENDSFSFFQLPDELLTNLSIGLSALP